MLGWTRPTTFVNGRVVTPSGEVPSVRFDRRILAVGDPPANGDSVVDLEGRFVLPGLINAHDHLELNHYGRLRGRTVYGNAGEWIEDLRPVIRDDLEIRRRRSAPLSDRLFIGGLKNLLAGATTVAHHNPHYRAFGRRFPVRLVDRMGWAHSLGLEAGPAGANGEAGGAVHARCASTPADWPFVVHAAEGVDEAAGSEVDELDARGCLRPNTVVVHGLAVSPTQWHRLFARGVSLTWCPASNVFLFGRTLDIRGLLTCPAARGHVCLGTDSRLTGGNDLLDELRSAAGSGAAPAEILHMVTAGAASVLRLADAGEVRPGAHADLCVLPDREGAPADVLVRTLRSGLALVMLAGQPMVGDLALAGAFKARGVRCGSIEVDGERKLIAQSLLKRMTRCSLREEGIGW